MIGQTLSHYKILSEISRGGMGIVYRAVDLKLDREVALKVLPPELVADPERKRRFVQEAKAAAKLEHPHIGVVHEIDEADGVTFIAMELIEGEQLKDILNEEQLPPTRALELAIEIAEGLARSHDKGIVHRDLKPANIMITEDGHAKIIDFGLAKLLEPLGAEGTDIETLTKGETDPGKVMGTVSYMSPEQARGQRVDSRSDTFSFGIVLYEMMTGNHPFRRTTPADTISAILKEPPPEWSWKSKEVPEALAHTLETMLAKEPEKRPTSLSGVVVILKDALANMRVESQPGLSAVWRLMRRPRVMIPLMLAVLVATVSAIWLYRRSANRHWVKEVALPEIERLTEEGRFEEAFDLAQTAEPHLTNDPLLESLWPRISQEVTLRTEPPGADVYLKEYFASDGDWEYLGKTPIEDLRLRRVLFRWKIEKEGYEVIEAMSMGTFDHLLDEAGTLHLDERGSVPPEMVRIPEGDSEVGTLGDFFIDKYEVTNRQFNEFVEAGGYRKHEYWKHDFVKDGRVLSWVEAMKDFRDSTGRPGPANWEAGDYSARENAHPVNGISWYEAAAYCEFTGKSLPTVHHWQRAAGLDINLRNLSAGPTAAFLSYRVSIMSSSNFAEQGPAPVGTYAGVNHFGVFDMAGNVREWCRNESPSGRYVRGGAWNDIPYMFRKRSQQSPFNRSPKNGLRCAQYPDRARIPEAAFGPVSFEGLRDYTIEKPAPEEVYQVYRNQFLYDASDLNVDVEWRREEAEDWTEERITFDAPYGNERMMAYLFLPKNTEPPYQTVIYFPGSGVQRNPNDEPYQFRVLDFYTKNGRAVLYPIYKGTHERRVTGFDNSLMSSHEYKEYVVLWVKEFRRSIDYLETRSDIDTDKLAYYGFSWGGWLGAVIPAVETRLKASILYVGGLRSRTPPRPEVDPFHYAPRVTVPTLMLNGRYDVSFPLELDVLPLYELLGTREEDKRLVLYDTDHFVPRRERIKESLAWLDRYLGPVE